MKVLALIPARSGSKRVPMKNFKKFAGTSLLERTMEQALQVAGIDQLVISTDRKDLVEENIKPHDKVQIHQRSSAASSDEAPAQAVIEETLKHYKADLLIYLQPTSPFREARDIEKALQLFMSGKFDSVISVTQMNPSFYYSLKIGPNNEAQFLFPQELKKRSQELDPVFSLNGAIYISSTEYILKHKSFFSGHVGTYTMPLEKSVDIDTIEDWQNAEQLFESGAK